MADDGRALIGLEDIYFGNGTKTVPTYGGQTREVTGIQLGSIPFTDAKTTAQALEEFQVALTQADYKSVHDNIDSILAVNAKLTDIARTSFNQDNINLLASNISKVIEVRDNLAMLATINPNMTRLHQLNSDMKYFIDRLQHIESCVAEDIGKALDLVHTTLSPMMAKLEAVQAYLDGKIENIRAELVAGNEMAYKLGTYDLKIQPVIGCRDPKIIVDDTKHTITWIVPTVKGNCTMAKPTQDQIAKAFAEYLVANPDFGGGAGSGLVPLTQDQVNNSIKQGVDNA